MHPKSLKGLSILSASLPLLLALLLLLPSASATNYNIANEVTTNDNADDYCTIRLDDTHGVVAWEEVGTSYVKAFTRFGTTLTFGSTTTVHGQDIAMAALSSDHFGIVYKSHDSPYNLWVQIGSVSGTTISWGGASDLAVVAQSPDITKMDTNKGCVAYSLTSNGWPYVRAFTISGETPTLGAAWVVSANAVNSAASVSVTGASSTSVFAAYTRTGDGTYVGYCSGTGVTFNVQTETKVSGTYASITTDVLAIDASHTIAIFPDGSNQVAAVVTYSGSWSKGANQVYSTYNAPRALSIDHSTEFLLSYGLVGSVCVRECSYSGTSITLGSEQQVGLSAAASDTTVMSLVGGSYYTVMYKINTDSDTQLAIASWVSTPVADFTGTPLPATTDDTVQFNFTGSEGGEACTYAWNFGDGTTSSLTNPTHKFARAGSYTVSLTVTNSGGSDTETKTAYVVVTGPYGGVYDMNFSGIFSWLVWVILLFGVSIALSFIRGEGFQLSLFTMTISNGIAVFTWVGMFPLWCYGLCAGLIIILLYMRVKE